MEIERGGAVSALRLMVVFEGTGKGLISIMQLPGFYGLGGR